MLRKHDIGHILNLVGPDATWRQSKMLPWGGDYRGRQGAAEFFQKLDATMETVSFEVNENIEHGEEVLSFGTYAGRSRETGKTGSAEWIVSMACAGRQDHCV
jgi:ketosteroid isomerase-like protein